MMATKPSVEWKRALADFANVQPILVAVRADAIGDARKTHVAWELRRRIPEIPSPLYYRQRLHLVCDGGLFTCLAPETGEELFSERLQALGQYAASPIACDGRIYLTSVNGVITVVAAEEEFRILGRNNLGEQIFATPALADRCIYVRTTEHLYAFGD